MFAVLHPDINPQVYSILPASLIAERVDEQKSKMELETTALGTISLIYKVTDTQAYTFFGIDYKRKKVLQCSGQ